MILGMEIGMIIFGVVSLTTGRLTLSKTRAVTGPLARGLAVVLLLPIPLAYTAHGFVHATFVTHGRRVGTDSRFVWSVIAVEAVITVLCLGIVYAVGLANAVDPTAAKEKQGKELPLRLEVALQPSPLPTARPLSTHVCQSARDQTCHSRLES
jgi:hypothetical protein